MKKERRESIFSGAFDAAPRQGALPVPFLHLLQQSRPTRPIALLTPNDLAITRAASEVFFAVRFEGQLKQLPRDRSRGGGFIAGLGGFYGEIANQQRNLRRPSGQVRTRALQTELG